MEDYPPKPSLPEARPPSVNRSLISLAVFMVFFYIVFDQDLRFLLVLVGVLIIHEMGHFIAMRNFGYRDVQMFFLPLVGAYVSGQKDEISQKQRSIVILAGPVPGIILGAILYWVSWQFQLEQLELPAQIFLFLNVFNLLPFTPLDGGRLIETLFFARNQIIQIGFMILSTAILVMMAIYVRNLFLLVIPFFLLMNITGRFRQNRIRKELAKQQIDYQKSFPELSDEEYWRIRDELLTQTPLLKGPAPGDHQIDPNLETRIAVQVRSLLNKAPENDLSTAERVALVILWVLFFIGPIVLSSMWTSEV